MTKKRAAFFNLLNVITDIIVSDLAYFLSIFVWLQIVHGGTSNIAQDTRILIIYSIYLIIIYRSSSLYSNSQTYTFGKEVLKVIQLNSISFLIFGLMLYFFRLEDFSRGVLGYFYVFSNALIIIKRAIFFLLRKKYPGAFNNINYAIVVGSGHLAQRFMQNVNKADNYLLTIVGYVSNTKGAAEHRLGVYEDLDRLLIEYNVDKVVIALEPDEISFMTQIITACDKQGTKAYIIPFYNDYIPSAPEIEVLGDVKLLNMRTTPLDNPLNAIQKRAFDILLSVFFILITSPVMIFTAIGVKLSSPGPIIFKQKRVGRNKKEFTMYKFRSMRVNDTSTTAWSTDTDPRKTRFGSFIRKTSLDELPQFFNVLKGDMSIVGPRPELLIFVNEFKEKIPLYMLKHQVRPGITGLAQIKGFRGDTSIEGRIRCDINYIENWNILWDFKIVFLTVFVALINKEKVSKKANNS